MARSTNSMAIAAFALAMSLSLPARATDGLYATGGGSGPGAGLSGLYLVNPLNGTSNLVWNFQNVHIYAGGLAYDTTTGTLYATGAEDSTTGTSRLFTINRATGAIAPFPGMSQ